ncbi:MAG: hypothetical protein QM533_00690 [Cytophagales bacterium]|nr:hypothetical protein [Cytophagales bacterium]
MQQLADKAQEMQGAQGLNGMQATEGCLDHSRAMAVVQDEALMREMLPMLRDSLRTELPKLRTAMSEQDTGTLSSVLHNLKGIVPIFADAQSSELLIAAQAACKANHSQQDAHAVLSAEVFEQMMLRLTQFQRSLEAQLASA